MPSGFKQSGEDSLYDDGFSGRLEQAEHWQAVKSILVGPIPELN